MSLHKKHFVGKHTYGQYGQGEHFPEQEVQITHTATCLIYQPPTSPKRELYPRSNKKNE